MSIALHLTTQSKTKYWEVILRMPIYSTRRLSYWKTGKKYHLVKILHSFNLTQVVNSITRPLSKTCLNHIWCSHPEHLNNISVIPSGMSDHLPIVATRKYNRTRSNNSRFNTISYRNIKNLDKATFSKSLKRHLGIALFFLTT